MTVHSFYGDTDVTMKKTSYYNNGNLAIQLMCDEGPFAMLTVNLNTKLAADEAYVDINNCPWAEAFIEENNLGKDTGKVGFSGFCCYPLYKFY